MDITTKNGTYNFYSFFDEVPSQLKNEDEENIAVLAGESTGQY